ncbi:hypothetical protein BGZ95_004063 [Linnemannia exigua]|uniref:WD40 repeat-like protein n=1 Tax=Linnemannia exigua TaxID=604196 RepID=A0AAD4D3T7_9FUNG|nr:hypothetical protein BGZ95_004063 [Linnemannia exigua]
MDGNVQVWNIESGLSKIDLIGQRQGRSVAYSPCGKWIATGSREKKICVWDINSGVLDRVLYGVTEGIPSLQYSPDGQELISVSYDGVIRIWDLTTGNGRDLWLDNSSIYLIRTLGYSPSGRLISDSCSGTRAVRIWDTSKDEPIYVLEHEKSVFFYAWSHCERWIATSCQDSVWLWRRSESDKAMEWNRAFVIRDFRGIINSINWKPNTLEFVTGCNDGSVRVWGLVEKADDVWSAQLIWGNKCNVLAASGSIISDAIRLSEANRQLLEQHS